MVFSLYLPNTGLSEIITLPHLLLSPGLSLSTSLLLAPYISPLLLLALDFLLAYNISILSNPFRPLSPFITFPSPYRVACIPLSRGPIRSASWANTPNQIGCCLPSDSSDGGLFTVFNLLFYPCI